MPLPAALRELLTAHGPSGYEAAPAAVWRRQAEAFAEVEGDALGSSTARVAGTGGGPTVAIVGHIDEIGLIVTHVDDKGFLWFKGVGGWDPIVLVGQRLEVLTREGPVAGVVGKRPIHLLDAEEVSVKAGDVEFTAKVRIDTPKEREYYKHGGILQFVLRQLMAPTG